MIKQRDKFSMTEYNYALNFDSFRYRDNSNYAVIDAIWFSTKKGLLTVHKGTLNHLDRNLHSVDDFILNFNGRYAGSTYFKWNGTDIWSSDSNYQKMVAAHDELDPILQNFPAIPEGYTGWHSIK